MEMRPARSAWLGMLFNSQLFLTVFLPIALLLQWAVIDNRSLWMASLLVLSAVFYSYWNPPMLLLLVGSIVLNWTMTQFTPDDAR